MFRTFVLLFAVGCIQAGETTKTGDYGGPTSPSSDDRCRGCDQSDTTDAYVDGGYLDGTDSEGAAETGGETGGTGGGTVETGGTGAGTGTGNTGAP